MAEGVASVSAIDFTQDEHFMSIETPLGKDRLLLTSLVGDEALSQLFSYQVEMLSTDHAIKPESLVGRKIGIVICDHDGNRRSINGMVGQFRAGALTLRDYRRYTAEIVPWMWFMTHTSDCRIFQKQSTPEIIEQVFQTFGFADFEIAVSRPDYPAHEFCVQYRETAFNFVSRLMEQSGMFYFFRHDGDRHVLVIADQNVSFQDLPDPTLIHVSGNQPDGQVTGWQHSFAFRPGRWAQTDYDFQVPSKNLLTTEPTVLKLASADRFERFEYPGRYVDKGPGARSTRMLMEVEEAGYHLVHGTSRYLHLRTGGRFKLRGHPCQNPGDTYVISRVRHEASDSTYLGNSGAPPSYSNSFEAIPADVRFRPQRTMAKPVVHGPQTAIVVGPPGEKIFTDRYGRVRVQFHWDRYGKHDDKSSCWIRVSQSWSGRGWGAVNLPHVGHEVVVSFLEGDPDCPMITGRVYNGENTMAMGMPENKTQSAIRDHSGNEIVMEGKSGSEDIRINATKDTNVVITHDYNETVKTGNRKIEVQSGTHTETIKGDTKVSIVSGSYVHFVAANQAQRVSKQSNVLASTDADVYVEAATSIQLHVGESTLWMEKGGNVEIKAKKIVLDAETISLSGQTSIELVGGEVNATAQATHTIKGALVKIN
jgi:type VI secretion system secreted protein VgrG